MNGGRGYITTCVCMVFLLQWLSTIIKERFELIGCYLTCFFFILQRKQVNPKRDTTKKPKRADKPVSLPQQHVDDEEVGVASLYALLVYCCVHRRSVRALTSC